MKQLLWLLPLLCACSRGSYAGPEDEAPSTGGGSSSGGMGAVLPLPRDTDFALASDFEGPCEKKLVVDVNLGHTPESAVRAAHCQVNGTEPDAATVTELAGQMRTLNHMRRVDMVRTLCQRAAKTCSLHYSDPWQQQVELTTPCERKGTRDLGAVLMYWSQCPSGVNCGMDWANTHAPGMNAASPLIEHTSDAAQTRGYYNPRNMGWWRRELLDARWSGLQFLALNTFGPDLAALPQAVEALQDIGGGIQIALFDDSWGWGKGEAPWNALPTFNDSEAAAQLIYQKWQEFHHAVPSEHWYRYQGKPLIIFYNAGTLKPENRSAATLTRLKQLFTAEFGEEPFLAVDRAFFQDPAMPGVASSQFRWNTFSNNALSHSEMNGVTYSHFMAKWDSVGRDRSDGLPALATDQLIKGPELLDQYLAESAASDLAVIATWNDLGEGTGISRNYDYYYQGAWLPPNAFVSRIRSAQCQ
jgi:hypothetical protein